MGREDIEEAPTGQDVREQSEGGAVSVDGPGEGLDSERESEEGPQAQSPDEATTSRHIRQRNSVTRLQPSAVPVSSGKLRRDGVTNSTGDSSNKRQRRYVAADVEEVEAQLSCLLISDLSAQGVQHGVVTLVSAELLALPYAAAY